MKLCDRIRALRISHNMTQKELGAAVNTSVVSVGKWENDIVNPTLDAIIALARTFNVSVDYLLGMESVRTEQNPLALNRKEQTLIRRYRSLDSYGRRAVDIICAAETERVMSTLSLKPAVVSAQRCIRYIPKYTTPSAAGVSFPVEGVDFEMIPVDDAVPRNADFAVKIQGDSMNPYIHDGDTVFVQKNASLSVGDIGIFCVDGALYCKQYYIDDEHHLNLVSANPQYQTTNIHIYPEADTDVRCYGKVLVGQQTPLPNYLHTSK